MSLATQNKKAYQQLTRGSSLNSKLLNNNGSRAQTAGHVMSEYNSNQTAILPLSELLRIKEKTLLGVDIVNEKKIKEKLELQEKSKNRVKNWPNTLEATRKKKDQIRFERFKAEEEERRRMDIEEAQLQAAIKKEIIDRSNKLIFEKNDKVKSLQSKLLLSDALLEREAQIEINNRKQEIEKQKEKMFDELTKQKIKQMEEEQIIKIEQQNNKKKLQQKVLKEQHDEMKQKYIKKMQEEKIEGEIIKQKSIQAKLKEEEEEQMRKQKIIQNLFDIKKGNEEILKQKEELIKIQQQEDLKIQDHGRKKEEMENLRKDKIQQKFQEKQKQRQQMIDAQVQILEKMKKDENIRINNQIQQAEQKANEANRIKQQKLEQLKSECYDCNALSTKIKSEKKQIEKIESEKYQNFWKKKNIEIQQDEDQQQQQRKLRDKKLQEFHLAQLREKQTQREKAYIDELKDAENMKQFQEEEEKNFQSWAQRTINEWEQNGKNIKPMLLELKKLNKV